MNLVKTGLTILPITDNYTLSLKNVSSIQIVQDERNTERVLVNNVPLIDRKEDYLPADGTICPQIDLEIKFVSGSIPTTHPVKLIYIKYRKLFEEKC